MGSTEVETYPVMLQQGNGLTRSLLV